MVEFVLLVGIVALLTLMIEAAVSEVRQAWKKRHAHKPVDAQEGSFFPLTEDVVRQGREGRSDKWADNPHFQEEGRK